MTKVLITGSRGFIGSHLLKALPHARGFDLKDGKDIRNRRQLRRAMKGVDVVVHLAAQTSVADAWVDPVDYYSHNVLGTANVIETALFCGVEHVVYASSASVYAPLDNPYSLSKAVCEDLFRLRADKLKTIAFRFMNVYGKGQNPSYGTVIPAFYKGIKKGKIKVYGDGKQTRDFIRVEDVAAVLALATKTVYADKFSGFTVMDLGTGTSVSVNRLAQKMMQTMGLTAQIEYTPARREARQSVANTRLVKKYFNYTPIFDLETGLDLINLEGL